MTHSKDRLADELRKIGLVDMANRAAAGYYHDFLSPLPFPEMQLIDDLAEAASPLALALRQRAIDGEFDATPEESEAWANSPDGIETFKHLLGDRGKS